MTMQQQVVVLRITRPADGTPPAEWNWTELIEDDCQLVAVGPVELIQDDEMRCDFDCDGCHS